MPYSIYKICCDNLPEFIYVGSTKSFLKRKHDHKKACNVRNQRLYTTIRENGGWENWRMIVLEECDETIDTRRKAEFIEEEYRVKLNANLNERVVYLSKEAKKIRDDTYNNREDIKEKRNLIYINNKEKFAARGKEWYEKNKEKCAARDKEYRENNKDKIMQWKNQSITCDCGRTIKISGKSRHELSLLHKKLIEDKNKIDKN